MAAMEVKPELPGDKFPHLRKAPLTEAIIDFRVKLRSEFDPKKFTALDVREKYPNSEEKNELRLAFEAGGGKPPQQKLQDLGIRAVFFSSHDRKTLVQFRRDGFTFNRLMPYTSWREIFPEAMRLWRIYADTAGELEVLRVAARYINRILLPVAVDFDDYLTAPPAIPNDVDPLISSFLTRITIHEPNSGLAAHVAQLLEPETEGKLPFILDIDVFKDNLTSSPNTDVTPVFEAIRDLKNRIFFGSLKAKLVDTYK